MIPLRFEKIMITYYPEGGNLIQGINNKIYFELITSNQQNELNGTLIE